MTEMTTIDACLSEIQYRLTNTSLFNNRSIVGCIKDGTIIITDVDKYATFKDYYNTIFTYFYQTYTCLNDEQFELAAVACNISESTRKNMMLVNGHTNEFIDKHTEDAKNVLSTIDMMVSNLRIYHCNTMSRICKEDFFNYAEVATLSENAINFMINGHDICKYFNNADTSSTFEHGVLAAYVMETLLESYNAKYPLDDYLEYTKAIEAVRKHSAKADNNQSRYCALLQDLDILSKMDLGWICSCHTLFYNSNTLDEVAWAELSKTFRKKYKGKTNEELFELSRSRLALDVSEFIVNDVLAVYDSSTEPLYINGCIAHLSERLL